MSLPIQIPVAAFIANGITTLFPFAFLVQLPGDLIVKIDGITQSIGTQYSISGLGVEAGGSITFMAAPSNGAKVLIYRSIALERTTDYQANGDLSEDVLDADFDRLWMALQDQISGAVVAQNLMRAPVGEAIGELPAAAARALKFAAFDASGNPMAATGATGTGTPISALGELLISRATAALMRADIGAIGSAELAAALPPFLRNMHNGFVMSTAGSSTTMTIGAGQCADSGNAVLLDLAAALNKTTAAWSVGAAGGLDTGTIAANTWYHFYVIRRPDTGVVDVLFSLSATAPTMPANYTQRRWVGAWRTNASSQWENWYQRGDEVLYQTAVVDFSVVAATTGARTLRTISTPSGVVVTARLILGSSANSMLLTDPARTDEAPSNTYSQTAGSSTFAAYELFVRTNTSSQIGERGLNTNSFSLRALGFNIAEAKGR